MKRLFLLPLVLLIGCGAVNTPAPTTAPLIPGATSQFDQDTYRALTTAHAIAQQAASNPSVLNATAKTILNQFIADLNAADLIYSAYHVGQATQVEMTTALAKVTADQSNFTGQGVK